MMIRKFDGQTDNPNSDLLNTTNDVESAEQRSQP
jgi:hypothetical protein